MSVLMEMSTVVVGGEQTKESNGTYKIIVGALNYLSGNGWYYEYTEQAAALYANGSALQQQAYNGEQLSEKEHPVLKGMGKKQAFDRFTSFDKNNMTNYITSYEVIKSNEICKLYGRPVYYIVATISPSGPYASELIDALEDPNKDVAFSVRSFSKRHVVNGITHKRQYRIIGYDNVSVPGISVATKKHSIKAGIFSGTLETDVESLEYQLTDSDIESILADQDDFMSDLDTESSKRMWNETLEFLSTCTSGNACLYDKW